MSNENPWAYNEARNRIREKQEAEKIVIEKKKEDFEVGKEKVYKKKKLDVFELKHRIETGRSLGSLKDEIRWALESGDISVDTYQNALHAIDQKEDSLDHGRIQKPLPEFILDPSILPLQNMSITQYFENQKLGKNIFIDVGGFVYGIAQGSVFLIYLAGKIILDFLLLPVDIYNFLKK